MAEGIIVGVLLITGMCVGGILVYLGVLIERGK